MPTPSEISPRASDAAAEKLGHAGLLGAMQPFSNDICATWHDAFGDSAHHAGIHELEILQLRDLSREGRVILLSAPRAGHGKTHLLGRVATGLKDSALVVAVPWQFANDVTWEGTGSGLLADLAATSDTLQKTCGGVCATLLRRLIQVGRIPSTNPEQALRVLAQDPLLIFHAEGSAKVIGEWFRRHFDQLRRPLAEVSGVEDAGTAERWINAIYLYVEQPTAASFAALNQCLAPNAEASLAVLLKLITAWKPVVLVADHMDGLYRDAVAGQSVARLALALSGIKGVHLVLSMNQDLWDTSFGRNLPSAFEDRLTERSLALHGLNAHEAEALVRLRLADAQVDEKSSVAFLGFLDLERFFMGRLSGSVSARGLLRHAAVQWREFVIAPEKKESHAESNAEGFLLETPLEKGALPSFDIPASEDSKRDALVPTIITLMPGTAAAEPESFLQEPTTNLAVAPEKSTRKLRAILSHLKVDTDSVPLADTVLEHGQSSLIADSSAIPAANETLQARFESLRNEFAQNGHASRIDWVTVSDLVRLAGKRFPVVHFDEVELPGLLGRSLPRWSMQGMEIVFGLNDFNDVRYWKTVSSFTAGRVAELAALAAASNEPAPQLKLVAFKGDFEGAGLAALIKDEVIPSALRAHVDAVHLDTRSLASLCAMRQLIREAEEGKMSTDDPTAVLSALASELDFFWKRVTRPK